MSWSKDLPQKEGFYWFFGEQFKGENPELRFVRVWKISNGFAYICEGVSMWESEMGRGFFKEVDLPVIDIKPEQWEVK